MKKSVERKANRLITKTIVVTMLLLNSFVLTSNTFAYWADIVDGTKETITTTFKIGSPSFVDHSFVIDSNDIDYKYLVDTSFLLESPKENKEDIVFGIIWNDEDLSDELRSKISKGDIEVFYDIIITKGGKKATKNQQRRYSKLIHLEVNENNLDEILYNDDPETYMVSLSLFEENRRNDYRNLRNKFEVTIVIRFEVDVD